MPQRDGISCAGLAAPLLLAAALALGTPDAPQALTFEVGPGLAFTSIGEVPWESLEAGDSVLIHWRADPYREKWVIGRQGDAGAPITVRGVPGPGGELPVIDGDGATTRLALDYWNEDRSVVKIGGSSVPADATARHIVIESLEIRGARPPHTFTDDRGNLQTYLENAAAIHVERGEGIVIRACVLHDSGNGLFVSSSDTQLSRDILVEGNYMHGNGIDGSIYHHNNYTAALGIVFQFNRFGPLRAGCLGNNLKDRSAGLVARYNWIEGGNRQLDLVDAEDSALLRSDPRYVETHVYGNVLVEEEGAGNRQVLHYGGDSGSPAGYRKGTLYFYGNTVLSYRTDRTTLFRLSTNDERCDARDNLVHAAAAAGDSLALMDGDGVLDWSHNWLKPGWRISFGAFNGVVNDDTTSVEGPDPAFRDEAGRDFHLAAGSPCIDAGGPLHPAVLPDHDLLRQYRKHASVEDRPRSGPVDIGAYELAAAPVADFTAAPRAGLAPLEVQFTDLSANGPASWVWDFDNDAVADSGAPDPLHVYAAPGLYTVSLDVRNAGGSDREVRADYICVAAEAPGPVHGLRMAPDRRGLAWDPAAGAGSYDVLRGELGRLGAGGGFPASVLDCLVDDAASNQAEDPEPPPPGGGFYYLVRASACGVPGTWDSAAPAQAGPRDPPILSSPAGCP